MPAALSPTALVTRPGAPFWTGSHEQAQLLNRCDQDCYDDSEASSHWKARCETDACAGCSGCGS